MKNKDCETSSGNLFADLGVSNPEERLAKVKLAIQINELIKQKGLTQKAAAELLGIDQPKVSALSKGRLSGFSLERLFLFLNNLDYDVTIKVTPKTRSRKNANVSVTVPRPLKQPDIKNRNVPSSSPSMQARKKKS